MGLLNAIYVLFVCLNYWLFNFVKPRKIINFQKNGKMIIIIIINYHKGSGKPRKFSRFRMTKQIVSLNSSRKI